MNTPRLKSIFISPIKSLTAFYRNSIQVEAGHPLPGDRQYALALPQTTGRHWQEKKVFLNLMQYPALASMRLDDTEMFFPLPHMPLTIGFGDLKTFISNHRNKIEKLVQRHLGEAYPYKNPPELVEVTPGGHFHDREPGYISLINRASVEDLCEKLEIDNVDMTVRRFRCNLEVDGLNPWEELDWVGSPITIGDVQFEVIKPITRCAAINVHPEKGERDLRLLQELRKLYPDHEKAWMGVLLKPLASGQLSRGDTLTLPDPWDMLEDLMDKGPLIS